MPRTPLEAPGEAAAVRNLIRTEWAPGRATDPARLGNCGGMIQLTMKRTTIRTAAGHHPRPHVPPRKAGRLSPSASVGTGKGSNNLPARRATPALGSLPITRVKIFQVRLRFNTSPPGNRLTHPSNLNCLPGDKIQIAHGDEKRNPELWAPIRDRTTGPTYHHSQVGQIWKLMRIRLQLRRPLRRRPHPRPMDHGHHSPHLR